MAATLAPGWGGSWAGVGERVTDLGWRADGVASCELRDVDDREDTARRCSRGREITAPPILQQARRLPISLRGALSSPVIKDGAYGDITELDGPRPRPSHFSQLHHNGEH